ncbi:Dam family site-specific DNA-(adenine-N6)-methyltransferase [Brucella intermedia]|uniref:Dam family site-specific DNA-(adenine-N6)-methyltransferase n=1 Tax=Brucella intermedia TaxID=94625 RepID=UPI00209A7458|nr:Dam family site-specific DNA-(adenine-N6)-methyltransferase [Brucella intermedia]MCO7727386.1 Dam family site-specific DNA-(adenine-N6)-methyltransferase [Brucella intermedia]
MNIHLKLQQVQPKPVLKWAGGKTQLLNELLAKIPRRYNKYIEPFIGGGAMFFAVQPRSGVIADVNPELVNLYRSLANDVDRVIRSLSSFENTEEEFYRVRAMKFDELAPEYAAARTIFLNRTCYNGLYRVNRKGQFNVPYGKYKNPVICQPEVLRAASCALQGAEIICADYKAVLSETARSGDFIFLDPPYLPVSEFSDFKRYTKDQFYEEDHRDLAKEVERLQGIGCHVVLTNSNHPLVHELFKAHEIEIINTRRNISSRASTRRGEDVIVNIKPFPRSVIRSVPSPVNEIALNYPSTRYMGSKEKLLPYIQDVCSNLNFTSALDLFSGSGVVGYLFKSLGKRVISNDYMAMSFAYTKAMIENSSHVLSDDDIAKLFDVRVMNDHFVEKNFDGLYYTNSDNKVIDIVRSNIKKIRNPHKKAIAMSALLRACMKKRARGIFTYTGMRYDDGRADLRMSMEDHIKNAAALINDSVFDNGYENVSLHGDALAVSHTADLVYMDPPYYSPLSDNEYVRRYHFVEGLARNWQGVDMQWNTKTKKFKSYPTPFSTEAGAVKAFDALFRMHRNSIILVSYSSNSLPTREDIVSIMSRYKKHVDVVAIDYRYSFGNQKNDSRNEVKEYLFVGH